jgi:hypothetical protein
MLQEAQTERERAPKLSGSKFIKQASSNSTDSSPKAESREQRGFSLCTTYSRLQRRGKGTACHMHGHMLFIGHSNLWGEVTLFWSHPRSHSTDLVFLCFTVALINLSSPSLPSCHTTKKKKKEQKCEKYKYEER